MNKPKSLIEIFNFLKPLVPAMDKFKATKDGALRADQIHLIKEVYPDIQVFCNGCLSRVFNVNCSSCVREVFEILISFYDRLARNPDINPVAENPSLSAFMAAEAAKLVPEKDLTPEQIKAAEDASKALMSEQEEDTLLHLLGITKENAPDEYLTALWAFVNHEDNLAQIPEAFHIKVAKKLEDLLMGEGISPEVRLNIITEYASTLNDDDEEKNALSSMAEAVKAELEKAKELKDKAVNVTDLDPNKALIDEIKANVQNDDDDFTSKVEVKNETKDEVINQERDGKPLSTDANISLNTPDTRTKWQKTADTKRENAAKKAAEAAKKAENDGK